MALWILPLPLGEDRGEGFTARHIPHPFVPSPRGRGEHSESWRQQPGTPVYAADFDAEGVRQALSQASKERKPDWRAK